eukprot:TRINITY_DN30770_c0_g1_i1.p1 TRINITY_DN30770_c0_g1~~TRINITY_DN30770_c0_g1_i1.p1  ORF type:complete len:377 (+),score=65.79 TRINITY_DN30770_c0_g1_i1:36-1166(+)
MQPVDPSRFESPSCQRGRRRSMTPGRGGVPWGTSTNFESVTRSTGRRSATPVRGRYGTPLRTTTCHEMQSSTPWGVDNVDYSASISRSTGRRRSCTPRRASAPMWFAHTSDTLQHDPRPEIPTLTALEKNNKERNPMQAKLLPDMGISRKKGTEKHLQGTEQTWFRSTPESGFADEARKALGEAQRKKEQQALNEHQYELHKAHDDMKKKNHDTCDDRYRKGKAYVSTQKLKEASHQFGAFWFGGLDAQVDKPVAAPRHYRQETTKIVPQESFPESSLSKSTEYQSNDKVTQVRQHKRLFPHQAHRPDFAVSQPPPTAAPIAKPSAPPFGVDPPQRVAFGVRNVNTSQNAPTEFTKQVHKMQLNEALSSYKKYVKV